MGESQRLRGGQETNMPCRPLKWKFIERRGKKREERHRGRDLLASSEE